MRIFFIASIVLLSLSCSSSNSVSTSTTALSRIPKTTAPVIATSTSNSLTKIFAAASTGLGLATASSDEDGNSYSNFVAEEDVGDKVTNYGACETLNFVRGAMAQAATADMILCFLGDLVDEADISTYADGEYHIVLIAISEGSEEESYKLKFKADLNSDGEVSSFEMFACQNGAQTEYVSQTINNDNQLTMLTKGSAEPDNAQVDSVVYQTNVTGTVNSSNRFTGTKTITMRYKNDFASGSGSDVNHNVATVTQTSEFITYNGYSCDKTTDGDPTCSSNSQQLFSYSELLDNNTDEVNFNLNLYALGNGAYVTSDSGSASSETAAGWNGDTGATDSSSTTETLRDYVDNNKSSVATVDPDFSEVSFDEDETWDCEGAVEETFRADEDNSTTCLSRLSIDQDIHLECNDL